jgi:hypothetical protein
MSWEHAQVAECLPSQCKALSSDFSTTPKIKKKKQQIMHVTTKHHSSATQYTIEY